MKKLLIVSLLLLFGFKTFGQNNFVEEVTPMVWTFPTSRPLIDFKTELTAATEQVNEKFNSGKTNEADLSENIAAIKSLIIKYLNKGNREQLAQLYLLDAHIYGDGLGNIAKARAILAQLARTLPNTAAGKTARDSLALESPILATESKTNLLESSSAHQEVSDHSETNKLKTPEISDISDKPLWEWNQETTVMAYLNVGNTNSSWNNPAEMALNAYVRVRAGANLGAEEQIIVTNSQAAIAAGCDDPMISYLNTRYALKQQDLEPGGFDSTSPVPINKLANAFCESARALNESQYPPIRKFYASLWAADYENRLYRRTHDQNHVSEAGYFGELAISNLAIAMNDQTMPEKEIYDDCEWLFNVYQEDKTTLKNSYIVIEPNLFDKHEKYVGLLVKGMYYISSAWQSRGDDYADKVTAQGWENFNQRLDVAEKALAEAWALNPSNPLIATKMITVELGQGKGRERMEMWFKRAMALDPNNAAACDAKCYYLQPKWYGTKGDVFSFCRECLSSPAWGGKVPLILANEYWSIYQQQQAYRIRQALKSPSVTFVADGQLPDDLKDNFSWDEVETAYKKYFQTNPNDIIERQKYIFLASKTSHWGVVIGQLPFIGNVHSVEIFGQDSTYESIVRRAKAMQHMHAPRLRVLPDYAHKFARVGDNVLFNVKMVSDHDYSAAYGHSFDRVGNSILFNVNVMAVNNDNTVIGLQETPIYYQWRLNGTNIIDATNSTFFIQQVGLQDNGDYSISIKNLNDSVTGTAGTLTVRKP